MSESAATVLALEQPKKLKEAHRRLVRAVAAVWCSPDVRADIDNRKNTRCSDLQRDDFLWHSLIESFSTLGGAIGYKGLVENRANYRQVEFRKLASMPDNKRVRHIASVLRRAKVRYPNMKARWLAENVNQLQALGGLKKAKRQLEHAQGVSGKLAFLMTFKGIGRKYARNIMMIVYHPEFRDFVALDSRVRNVSKELGIKFSTYEAEERFYINVAHAAGLNGWELDRLLYWYSERVLAELVADNSRRSRLLHQPRSRY